MDNDPLVGSHAGHADGLHAAKGKVDHLNAEEFPDRLSEIGGHILVNCCKGVVCHDHVAGGIHRLIQEQDLAVLCQKADLFLGREPRYNNAPAVTGNKGTDNRAPLYRCLDERDLERLANSGFKLLRRLRRNDRDIAEHPGKYPDVRVACKRDRAFHLRFRCKFCLNLPVLQLHGTDPDF